MRVRPAWRTALLVGAALCTLFAPSCAAAQAIEWRGPAGAPSDDEVAGARDAYGRGLQRLDAGDHQGALAEFRSSFALSGADAALFNGAFALTRLGRFVEARAALEVLDAMQPPEEVRASAAELRTEVESGLAFVRLLQVPDGASVSLDDRPVEARPVEEAVDPGAHRVLVRAAGREPFRWSGELLSGERRVLEVAMGAPASGGDDAGLIAGVSLGVVLGVAVAVLVPTLLVLDAEAQLSGDAPHVLVLP